MLAVAILCTWAAPEAAHAKDDGDTWSAVRVVRLASPTAIGVRASYTDIRTGGDAAGIALAAQGTAYGDGTISVRSSTVSHIGQTSGIEGALAGDLAIGYRFDLMPTAGFLARLGARGFVVGNDRLFASALEAPQAQVGFQYMTGTDAWSGGTTFFGGRSSYAAVPILIEVAARGSLAVAARQEIDTANRSFKPAPAWGGHAAVGVGPLHLETSFTQIAPTGASRAAFDIAEGTLCVSIKKMSVCGDGRAMWTGVFAPDGAYRRDRVVFAGFLFGLQL